MPLKRTSDGLLPSNAQKNVEKFLHDQRFKFPNIKEREYGKEYIFLCPFCEGGSSGEISFNVNVDKGTARCWRASCNFGGSVEWFIHKYLDIPYKQAHELVHGDEELTLESVDKDLDLIEEDIDRQFYESMQKITSGTKNYNESAWVEGSEPIEDSDSEIVSRFINWIHRRGYDYENFVDMHNIYIPPQQGVMEDRVLFEVLTEGNRAYQAYSLDESDLKTLNPGGGILSSKMLYKYDLCAKIKPKRVFVCEGIFDVARILSFGFAAVCGFGVYLSKRQTNLLSNLNVDEIVICFDHIKSDDQHDGVKEEIANDLMDSVLDKDISIMDINEENYLGDDFKDGTDPDDLTKEQFLEYWKNRRKVVDDSKLLEHTLSEMESEMKTDVGDVL